MDVWAEHFETLLNVEDVKVAGNVVVWNEGRIPFLGERMLLALQKKRYFGG